jgi:hypothetical protein
LLVVLPGTPATRKKNHHLKPRLGQHTVHLFVMDGDVGARADLSWHELIRGAYLARTPTERRQIHGFRTSLRKQLALLSTPSEVAG